MVRESTRSDGKILNGLDIPMPFPEVSVPSAFASDRLAYRHSLYSDGLNAKEEQFSINSMHWGLAAIAGAHSPCHIDAAGCATELRLQVGSKYWVIVTPKDTSMGSIRLFLDEFDPELPDPSRFNYEAVRVNGGHTM